MPESYYEEAQQSVDEEIWNAEIRREEERTITHGE